jgi:hypothetical protein
VASACLASVQVLSDRSTMQPQVIGGVKIMAPVRPEYRTILTPEACQLVAHLARYCT